MAGAADGKGAADVTGAGVSAGDAGAGGPVEGADASKAKLRPLRLGAREWAGVVIGVTVAGYAGVWTHLEYLPISAWLIGTSLCIVAACVPVRRYEMMLAAMTNLVYFFAMVAASAARWQQDGWGSGSVVPAELMDHPFMWLVAACVLLLALAFSMVPAMYLGLVVGWLHRRGLAGGVADAQSEARSRTGEGSP